jgi:hypothetical protein
MALTAMEQQGRNRLHPDVIAASALISVDIPPWCRCVPPRAWRAAIGLAGGIDPYTYVNGDPLSYVDSLGRLLHLIVATNATNVTTNALTLGTRKQLVIENSSTT